MSGLRTSCHTQKHALPYRNTLILLYPSPFLTLEGRLRLPWVPRSPRRFPSDYSRVQPGSPAGWGGLRPSGGSSRQTGSTGQDHFPCYPSARVCDPAVRQRDRRGHQEDYSGLQETKTAVSDVLIMVARQHYILSPLCGHQFSEKVVEGTIEEIFHGLFYIGNLNCTICVPSFCSRPCGSSRDPLNTLLSCPSSLISH